MRVVVPELPLMALLNNVSLFTAIEVLMCVYPPCFPDRCVHFFGLSKE